VCVRACVRACVGMTDASVVRERARTAREQRQECLLIYPALSILVKLGPEEFDRFWRYLKPHCIDRLHHTHRRRHRQTRKNARDTQESHERAHTTKRKIQSVGITSRGKRGQTEEAREVPRGEGGGRGRKWEGGKKRRDRAKLIASDDTALLLVQIQENAAWSGILTGRHNTRSVSNTCEI
jgi:hypothetical protein